MDVLTTAAVKARAGELGFDLCGVASADDHLELASLRQWLDRGFGATMTWLHRTAGRRADVRRVLPSARSVIVTATLYNVRGKGAGVDPPTDTALISRYAWGQDYHQVVGRRLDELLAWMRGAAGMPFDARVYVDTGPVQERVYAFHAGLGWIGKNTCLINARLGSWLFLGVILCSLPLDADRRAEERCGTCTRCLDACPTGALVAPRVLDARCCLSYLTIERRGAIPAAERSLLGRHVFGCDICQQVCPWNDGAPVSVAPQWQPRPGLDRPRLVDLWRQADDGLAALIEGAPLTRAGVAGLRRNLAIAIGNSASADGVAALERWTGREARAAAPTVADPVVREHVEWALERLRLDRVHSNPVHGPAGRGPANRHHP